MKFKKTGKECIQKVNESIFFYFKTSQENIQVILVYFYYTINIFIKVKIYFICNQNI